MLIRRFPAAAGRAVRRRLCTASSSAELPELSRWGSFGKSAAQVETLEQAIRQDGERQVAITKEIAAIGIKFQAMLTRPVQYFTDAEWREGWLAAADEPLLRFSRLNEKLLDGCEAAYEAVAAEFHADEPDIEQFVRSGAIDPKLAAVMERTLAEYAAAGLKPTLETGRINAQVLLVDSSQSDADGFVATVVFRTRDARSSTAISRVSRPEGAAAAVVDEEEDPVAAAVAATQAEMAAAVAATQAEMAAAAESSQEARAAQLAALQARQPDAASAGAASGAVSSSAPAEAAENDAGTGAEAKASEGAGARGSAGTEETEGAAAAAEPAEPAAAAAEGEHRFEDCIQLWTFTAEQPSMGPYLSWLRAAVQEDVGAGEEGGGDGAAVAAADIDTGVRWKLRDINFVVRDYVPPEGATDPVEHANEVLMRSVATAGLALVLAYTLFKIATRPARPRRNEDDGPRGMRQPGSGDPLAMRFGASPSAAGRHPGGEPSSATSTNKWGDEVSS